MSISMLKITQEFVFIMLKPSAVSSVELTNLIENKLLQYGNIKYQRSSIVTKRNISRHYKNSRSSLWYPLVVNYLVDKPVTYFLLESKPEKNHLFIKGSFAKFLKQEVIGPANIFKAKSSHIRRIALKKFPFCFLDNLIHCSDNTKEALEEMRIWYRDEPNSIEEFEPIALATN